MVEPSAKPGYAFLMRAFVVSRGSRASVWALLLCSLASLRADELAPHWAFRPIVHPPVPTASDPFVSGPIDAFVLDRLRAHGLEPSESAGRSTWLRRVSWDLRGLPPSPEERRAFLRDEAPGARARVIDRWLASPGFGERRAQDWLDQARFADTSGFAADRYRSIWLYRDWVIGALNDDLPFDRFTIAQLAGDLLPDATVDDHVATGFHRNAMQAKGNNPRIEEFRIKGIVDRVNTTAQVWLGLSVECAECHDHKHDPVTQKDYYRLFAYFNNVPHVGEGFGVHGPRMQVLPREARERKTRLEEERSRLVAQLDAMRATDSYLQRARQFVRLSAASENDPPSDTLVGLWCERALSADSSFTDADVDVARVPLDLTQEPRGDLTIAAWIRTRASVANIVSKYDWRAGERSFVFGIGGEGEPKQRPGHLFAWVSSEAETFLGLEIESSRPVNDGEWHHVAFVFRAGHDVRLVIDGAVDSDARVQGAAPKTLARSARDLVIGAGFRNSEHPNAYRFEGRLSDVRVERRAASLIDLLGMALRPYAADEPPSSAVLALYNSVDPHAQRLREEQSDLERRVRELQRSAIETAVVKELETPRATHVLVRGNFENPGERVEPGLPAALAKGATEQPTDRLGFARWLVSEDNPLTARVTVNRLWQSFFGRGIVGTDADFGTHGDPPAHPELLDWLASEFIRNDWRVKPIVRQIVLSSTYGQASRVRPEAMRTDPENRLLWRAPRLRLPAEQVRDGALFAAGLLDRRIGGPSVFPAQPPGIWEERGQSDGGASNMKWNLSPGRDRYRRGLYTFWKRMAMYPSLAVFDAPTRQRCVTRRSVTNTPLQALATLNDTVFVEAAQMLAVRIVDGNPDRLSEAPRRNEVDEVATRNDRIRRAFELVLSREPSDDERALFAEYVASQRRHLSRNRDARDALAPPPNRDAGDARITDLAVWTLTSSVMLNLDETITRE